MPTDTAAKYLADIRKDIESIESSKSSSLLPLNPSLHLLTRVYSWLGISLETDNQIGTTSADQRARRPSWLQRQRWSIAYALVTTGLIVWFLFFVTISRSSIHRFRRQTEHTKPILRVLINSVIYVYLTNNLFAIGHYAGWFHRGPGRATKLIQHLTKMPSFSKTNESSTLIDSVSAENSNNKKITEFIVVRIWLGLVFAVFCSNLFGLVLGVESHVTERTILEHIQYIFYYTIRRTIQNLAFSGIFFQVTIFVYVAFVYREQLRKVQAEVDQLDYHGLVRVRRYLIQLDQHYRITSQQLQFPIMCCLFSFSLVLIGTLCLWLISLSSTLYGGFMAFVFLMVSDAVLVLAVFIFYGDLVHHQYRQLLHHIRIRVLQWDNQTLLSFQRLCIDCSEFGQFQFRLYHSFPLNQALLLSLSTFVLNYIVLLIQTDHTHSNRQFLSYNITNTTTSNANNNNNFFG